MVMVGCNSTGLTYDQEYVLTHNPITEVGDTYSRLSLSKDNTFVMSANACHDVETFSGEYFIEDNWLYLVPENYYCNEEEVACDSQGIRLEIIESKKLIIELGLLCIAPGSEFSIE